MIQEAYKMSRIDSHATVVKFLVTSQRELIDKLDLLHLDNRWTMHNTGQDSLFFLKIVILTNLPTIDRTLIIDKFLNVKAFSKEQKQIPLSLNIINDTRQIENQIDSYSPPRNPETSTTTVKTFVEQAVGDINCAIELINNVDNNLMELDNSSLRTFLNFILDQLNYLITKSTIVAIISTPRFLH